MEPTGPDLLITNRQGVDGVADLITNRQGVDGVAGNAARA